jgi:DNA-binding ferritin-like protein (Dps family)
MGVHINENQRTEGEQVMSIWEKITGSDMTREMRAFESRVKKLPADYQGSWEKITANLWVHSDFTGRNLMPILDGVVGLLEESAAEGQSVQEALGDDINGFCSALAGEEGAKSYRDKWRAQLNDSIARKLGK